MFRRVVSLGLAFLMLFEFGTGSVFAKGDGDFNTAKDKDTEEPKYVDYCRGAPKNKFNKTVDVDCAIDSIFPKFKSDKKKMSISLTQLGETGEIDVHMWKYAGLEGLAKKFKEWISGAAVKSIKAELTANFIKETNKLFNLNSNEDATEIIEKWVKMSNYSAPIVKSVSKDIDELKEKMYSYTEFQGDLEKAATGGTFGALLGGVGGAGIGGLVGTGTAAAGGATVAGGAAAAGGAVVVSEGIVACGTAAIGSVAVAPIIFCALAGAALIGAGGSIWMYHSSKKQRKNEKIRQKLKKSAQQRRRFDVYSWALENILELIENDAWVGNDLLRAELNYEKDLPNAATNFINVGIDVPQNVTVIFERLSKKLYETKEEFLKRDYKEEL